MLLIRAIVNVVISTNYIIFITGLVKIKIHFKRKGKCIIFVNIDTLLVHIYYPL